MMESPRLGTAGCGVREPAAGHSWEGDTARWGCSRAQLDAESAAGHSWTLWGAGRGGQHWGMQRSWDTSRRGQRWGGEMAQKQGPSTAGGAQLELGHSWGAAGVAVAQLAAMGHPRPVKVRVLVAAASTAGAHLGGSRAVSHGPAAARTAGAAHFWWGAHLGGHRAQVTASGSHSRRGCPGLGLPSPGTRRWGGASACWAAAELISKELKIGRKTVSH